MKALILAATITAIVSAQSDSAAAGSWTAEFKGQTFIRLEFRTMQGKLGGRISLGDMQVDKEGAVRHVEAPRREPTAIFDVVQQGTTVTFSRKDGRSTDRFEFRVLDSTRGELQLIPTEALRKEMAAEGIPMPKPIILTRKSGA